MTRKIWMNFFIMLLMIPLSACQSGEYYQFQTKPPSAEEALALDHDADLFQWEGTVYQTNVDWTKELTLTKQQQVGVIKKTSSENFQHGTASQLKKGVAIYAAKERNDVLIVEQNGQLKIYVALIEG
ncbi:hypothetical protein [Bacillus sp. 179-C3.3 HS]|uniref:hypothetical protein n=1 Tax=Bacillus sp. 179-C3.3 HS TaxID=3232162 RepID=UPI00399F7D48